MRRLIAVGGMSRDAYLVRGLLRCQRCHRLMAPVFDPTAGVRGYSCGPRCRQRVLDAAIVERDLMLCALIRAHRHQADAPVVPVEQLEHWLHQPHRAAHLLQTVYLAVTVTSTGKLRPQWRSSADRDRAESAPTGLRAHRPNEYPHPLSSPSTPRRQRCCPPTRPSPRPV